MWKHGFLSDKYTIWTAYDDSMKDMVIAGLVTSAVPIILSLFMPNWYLSDKQNAVDDSALDHDDEGEQSAWDWVINGHFPNTASNKIEVIVKSANVLTFRLYLQN